MPKAKKPLGSKIIKDFDGNNSPDDFTIPSIGIEDMDKAVFNLFNEKLSFEVEQKGKLQKVPVIFASGERFALTRRKKSNSRQKQYTYFASNINHEKRH